MNLTDNEREMLILTAEGDDPPEWPDHAFDTSCALRNKGLIRYHEDKVEWRLTDRGRDRLIADLSRLVAQQFALPKPTPAPSPAEAPDA